MKHREAECGVLVHDCGSKTGYSRFDLPLYDHVYEGYADTSPSENGVQCPARFDIPTYVVQDVTYVDVSTAIEMLEREPQKENTQSFTRSNDIRVSMNILTTTTTTTTIFQQQYSNAIF